MAPAAPWLNWPDAAVLTNLSTTERARYASLLRFMMEIESAKNVVTVAGRQPPSWKKIHHSYNRRHVYDPLDRRIRSKYSLSSRFCNSKKEMEELIIRNQQAAVVPVLAPAPAAPRVTLPIRTPLPSAPMKARTNRALPAQEIEDEEEIEEEEDIEMTEEERLKADLRLMEFFGFSSI